MQVLFISIYRTQAPSLASGTTRRKRRCLITRKVHQPRQKRTPPPPPPETVGAAAVAAPPTSQLSRQPAQAASCSTTQVVVATDVTLDPVQIALDTFDNVVSASISHSSTNLENAVSSHIYRTLFKQGVQTLANSFPQPLSPSDLIDVSISTLKSLGLL